MSDDRYDDGQREYGSLFDDSPESGVSAGGGGDDSFVDEFDEEWGDEGFGDVTWADDAPAAVDSTDVDNYQPPATAAPQPHVDDSVANVDRSTSMFDAVDAGAPIGADESADVGVWAEQPGERGADGGVDVWSSFNSESPKWDEDGSPIEPSRRPPSAQSADSPRRVVIEEESLRDAGSVPGAGDSSEFAADRIRIGTDPSRGGRESSSRSRGGDRRSGRGGEINRRSAVRAPESSGRNLPVAIGVGVLMAGVFFAVLRLDALKYWGAVAVVTLVVGAAAVEFLTRVGDKGYRPALVPGVAACVAAPLVAYWVGDAGLPLVIAFGFMAVAASFIGASSVDSAPMPNIAITNLGIVWIGLLGSYAMLILRFSTANASSIDIAQNYGTDTLFLVALGVVLNDTGALLIGSTAGRTPLRRWISPNKTVEGWMGGALLTIVSMILYRQFVTEASTWVGYRDLLLLALTISFMAPLGDLVESMLKRNMEIKDFGTLVPGHGGVLDRFDGFLFTLPAVYYLTEVLQPWA